MSYFEECGYLRLAGRQQTILFLEDFIHTVKEISVSPGNPGNRDGSAQLRNISPLFTFNYSVASKKEFPFQPRMGRFFSWFCFTVISIIYMLKCHLDLWSAARSH